MGGGHDSGGGMRWLLTYADLITLLLAFFIILYAGSKTDLERFAKLAVSLRQGFGVNVMPAGGGEGILAGEGGGIVPFPSMPQRNKDFMMVSQALAEQTKATGTLKSVAVNMHREGIAITISGGLLFPSGGVELSQESKGVLDGVARILVPMPNQIRVEAHTDDLPTNYPLYVTNWELSVTRAASVVRYLIDYGQIKPERLMAVGRSEFSPLFPNDSREHRAQNRRADIVIVYSPDEQSISGSLNLSDGSVLSTPLERK